MRLLKFVLICTCIAACKKEQEEMRVPQAVYSVGMNIRLNDIELLTDSVWIACGGNRNSEGYIFRTENAGQTWDRFETNTSRSVYCLAFRDGLHGIAGSDFLDLWQTQDGGKTWQYYWLGAQVPINEEDRPAVRDVYFATDSVWYFCGGENLYKGVLYKTIDAGNTWAFEYHDHEFRALDFTQNGVGICAGHGAVRRFELGLNSSIHSDFQDDFMMDAIFLDNQRCLGVTTSGHIQTSADAGQSWSKVEKQDKALFNRTQLNSLTRHQSTLVAVGNYGKIVISDDEGSSWKTYSTEENAHLLRVKSMGQKMFVTTSDGRILQF